MPLLSMKLNKERLGRYDAAARERAIFILEYGNGQIS
jgi:hypothetical protein